MYPAICQRKWVYAHKETHARPHATLSTLPAPALIRIYSSATVACLFSSTRCCLLSLAALVFARLASISSLMILSRCFSALALWICEGALVGFSNNDVTKLRTYVFDESTLVLERVTLAERVELVVEVLVDLAAGAVLDEETAEDTLVTHP